MRRVVILNPAARDGRNAALRDRLPPLLRAAGLAADVVETAGTGDAERLAAAHADADLVIVAGGDGTVHEVVNGLAGTGAALGVLPAGTGNDYAYAVGMPTALAEAVAALAAAPAVPVDVGRVTWEDTDGARHARRFANSLGAGFDAHVSALAAETKWMGGRTAYLAAVLRTLWAWRRPTVQARVAWADAVRQPAGDGGFGLEPAAEPFEGPLFLCEVGIGPSVGGGFRLTPGARLDDGLFDVCLVRHLAPGRALRLLPQTFSGAHVGLPEVQMVRTPRLDLRVDAGALAVHADGEVLAFAAKHVRAEVLPGALRVRAPGLTGSAA